MTLLTSSTTLSIAASATQAAETSLIVVPASVPGTGKGRIEHPSLGVWHYPSCPDEWTYLDGDLIVPPIWAHAQTLSGGADALWAGSIRDLEVEERWVSGICPLDHLRMLLSFWTNPPNPDTGYVTWWPEYSTTLGFRVAITGVSAGYQGVMLDYMSRQGVARGPVVLKLRIVDRA